MSEWWSVLPVLCLALGFAAGWVLRGREPRAYVPPVEVEDAEDKKKPAESVNRGFFT